MNSRKILAEALSDKDKKFAAKMAGQFPKGRGDKVHFRHQGAVFGFDIGDLVFIKKHGWLKVTSLWPLKGRLHDGPPAIYPFDLQDVFNVIEVKLDSLTPAERRARRGG